MKNRKMRTKRTALAATCGAMLLVAPFAPVFAATPSGNAGVCVKLDTTGHVIAAKITESSGDPGTDNAIAEMATQLHWAKPYPRPGWMPMRLGVGNAAQSMKPTPPCDQAVEAAAAPAPPQHRRRRVIRAVSAEPN